MTGSVAAAEAGPKDEAGRAETGPGAARATAAAPLLTVSGLSVSFGWLRALEDVNLSVQTGELVALAGENGAGKTTLVRCIAGEVVPASGEVFFAGRRMPADQAAAVKQGIAVVWQDLALCDNLDVAANIMLGQERRRLLMSDTRFHLAAAGSGNWWRWRGPWAANPGCWPWTSRPPRSV
jgi:D-xylose transport system ATP-binding protein